MSENEDGGPPEIVCYGLEGFPVIQGALTEIGCRGGIQQPKRLTHQIERARDEDRGVSRG